MTPFEQLQVLYNQLFNLNNEVKNLIETEDFNELMSKIHYKDILLEKILIVREHLQMNSEQRLELKALEDDIAKLELENINTLTEIKNRVFAEINSLNKQQKVNQTYSTMTAEDTESTIEFSE